MAHQSPPRYWRSVDWSWLEREYPPPPDYRDRVGQLTDDAIAELRNRRFLERVADAWKMPFYQRLWGAVGLEPGDIRCLDDLDLIPMFTSDDLKDAIVVAPPFGDHHPIGRDDLGRSPVKIQTSGGTSGFPRVTLFDTTAWEVQAIQGARAMWGQGARPGDIVQNTFTCSLGNAGWLGYNACRWLGCAPLTTGSGAVTPSERQLEFARTFGTNGWFAHGEYLGRLAAVAEDTGFDLRQLPTKFLHTYLGVDTDGLFRQSLQEAWGAPVYDNYGTHEVGLIAWECEHQAGMHVFEDTVVLQTVDSDGARALAVGDEGDLVATSLHRSVPPIIRFNLRDRMRRYDRQDCPCGLRTEKLSTFLGRSDEMVKLRGQNVYPRSCQTAVLEHPDTTGEYLCVVTERGDGVRRATEMTIRIERRADEVDADRLAAELATRLNDVLSVRVDIEIAEAGALAPLTGLGGEGKVKRLLDLR